MAKYLLIISILVTLSFSVYCASNNDATLKMEIQKICKYFNRTGRIEFVQQLLKKDDCWQKVLPRGIYARYVKCGEKLNYTTADQVRTFCADIDASIGLIKESGVCAKDLITQEFNDKFTKCLEQSRGNLEDHEITIID